MKRKVIQIANSTQLVSLPRKWCKKLNIKKGDELDVQEKGSQIVVSAEGNKEHERIHLNIKHLEPMTGRFIHAMYKRGVDEIKVNFDKQKELEIVQKALGKETVGYEIVEQGKDFCIIKNVSGDLEDFDPILRRTFLLLITMAEAGLAALKSKNVDNFRSLLPLEESNNRFTTTCRRFINKQNTDALVGPLYYIIEDLENIADQYKYLYQYLATLDLKKAKISPAAIELFNTANEMLKMYYSTFYKIDKDNIAELGRTRKQVVKQWYEALSSHKNFSSVDIAVMSHMVVLVQKIFNLTGPLIAMKGCD